MPRLTPFMASAGKKQMGKLVATYAMTIKQIGADIEFLTSMEDNE